MGPYFSKKHPNEVLKGKATIIPTANTHVHRGPPTKILLQISKAASLPQKIPSILDTVMEVPWIFLSRCQISDIEASKRHGTLVARQMRVIFSGNGDLVNIPQKWMICLRTSCLLAKQGLNLTDLISEDLFFNHFWLEGFNDKFSGDRMPFVLGWTTSPWDPHTFWPPQQSRGLKVSLKPTGRTQGIIL